MNATQKEWVEWLFSLDYYQSEPLKKVEIPGVTSHVVRVPGCFIYVFTHKDDATGLDVSISTVSQTEIQLLNSISIDEEMIQESINQFTKKQ